MYIPFNIGRAPAGGEWRACSFESSQNRARNVCEGFSWKYLQPAIALFIPMKGRADLNWQRRDEGTRAANSKALSRA